MGIVNANRTGFVFAVLLGGWHLLWALFVAVGWAQAVINFVFWMHFINPVYVIQPFSFGIALTLIAVTSGLGYVIGYSLSYLWNWIHKGASRGEATQEAAAATKAA